MDFFSYVSIVSSIILSLGIARILTGLAKILDKNVRKRTYLVHLLWSLMCFSFLVLNWWILARWSSVTTWNFFLNLFILLTPTVTFLLSMILYPDTFDNVVNFKKLYYTNHRCFFALGALLTPLDAVDTLLKGIDHFRAQGTIYIVTIVLIFALCVIGVWTKKREVPQVLRYIFPNISNYLHKHQSFCLSLASLEKLY